MTETPRLPSAATGPVGTTHADRTPRSEVAAGPAFQALLERLTARAAELEAKSKALETPEQLPQAVDAARASLEEALDLGQKLLDAYRAAQIAQDAAEVER
jgi:hypothetical protein